MNVVLLKEGDRVSVKMRRTSERCLGTIIAVGRVSESGPLIVNENRALIDGDDGIPFEATLDDIELVTA